MQGSKQRRWPKALWFFILVCSFVKSLSGFAIEGPAKLSCEELLDAAGQSSSSQTWTLETTSRSIDEEQDLELIVKLSKAYEEILDRLAAQGFRAENFLELKNQGAFFSLSEKGGSEIRYYQGALERIRVLGTKVHNKEYLFAKFSSLIQEQVSRIKNHAHQEKLQIEATAKIRSPLTRVMHPEYFSESIVRFLDSETLLEILHSNASMKTKLKVSFFRSNFGPTKYELEWSGLKPPLALSEDASLFAIAAAKEFPGEIRVIETKTGRQFLGAKYLPNLEVQAVAFSKNREYLYLSLSNHSVEVWDLSRCKRLERVETQGDYASAIFPSPDGKSVVLRLFDGSIKLWRPQWSFFQLFKGTFRAADLLQGPRILTGSFVKSLEGPSRDVIFSANGRFAYISNGSFVKIWDLEQFKEVAGMRSREIIEAMVLSKNEDRLITLDREGGLYFWSLKSGILENYASGVALYATRLLFSPDEKYLITDEYAGVLRNPKTGAEIKRFNERSVALGDSAISPDLRYMISQVGPFRNRYIFDFEVYQNE